jgi:Ca2+/H+ antiporter, TMEM165/GDT1 family
MDWRVLGTTFAAVFLAELGDKTQLAALSFATSTTSRLSVFLGASLALIATTAIAVLFGEALTRFVSPQMLRRAAGALFVAIGAWVLWSSFRPSG